MRPHRTSDPDAPRTSPTSRQHHRWLPWAVGLVVALVVLGPALAPGPVFNLDLVLTPDLPVPRGVWGLGPELPRRVPMWLPVAWLSPLIGGDTAGKLLMVAAVTVAFAGAYRMAGDRSVLCGYTSAAIYTLSPFLLTRLAVGHLMIVVPMAVLPWVVDDLLRPDRDLRRTFLGALALGLAGHFGGAVALIVIAVGLAASRGRRAGAVLGLALLAQLPWVVPGIVVWAQGARIGDAAPFGTLAEGADGVAGVLAGHGFWNPLFQVGWPGGPVVGVAGVVLTGLALVGSRDLPGPTRRAREALAVIGLALAVVSLVPGLRDVYVAASRNPVGSVLREGHRAFPLFLLWQAPAAAFGARRLAGRLAGAGAGRGAGSGLLEVLPLVVALWLAGPGLWGIGGQLQTSTLPPEWIEMRARILAEPGTVVALPWNQYFDLSFAGDRRVLNPLPLYLGGDVITSSDLEIGDDDRPERIDPREEVVDRAVQRLLQEEPVAEDLASVGVRWVVLLHETNWAPYSPLTIDPGLERVIRAPALELYRVRSWPGDVWQAEGASRQVVPSEARVEPVISVDPSGPAVVSRPAAGGWVRGLSGAGEAPGGLLALPAGDGPVWFWPVVPVLLAYLVTGVGVVWAVLPRIRRREGRERRPRSVAEPAPEATGSHEMPPSSV